MRVGNHASLLMRFPRRHSALAKKHCNISDWQMSLARIKFNYLRTNSLACQLTLGLLLVLFVLNLDALN